MLNRPTWTLPREVGQLVDREDAAVGPGQQAEVHGQLVGEQVPAARRLDRVHVADEVGDGDVGRRQLLDVALRRAAARRSAVASPHSAEPLPRVLGDRREGVVVDFAAGDDRESPRPGSGSSCRRMRLLAWPRRPSRMKWCRASSALSSCGTMVSS